MRYVMVVEYDGTDYSGWQRQDNAPSVQQTIEDKLSVFLQKKTVIVASGRTDKGVHAYGQVAHFDTDSNIPPANMRYAVNTMLPHDIRIVDMYEVDADFHAQYSAKRKTYVYKTYVSRVLSPMRARYYAQVIPEVNVELMKQAAKCLVGEHDFRAFCSTGSSIQNKVRELYRVDINVQGDEIIFEIEGNGFLYNMVRIIVGTLVFIGRGMLPVDTTQKMLDTGIRKLGGKTYPACGLALKSVEY